MLMAMSEVIYASEHYILPLWSVGAQYATRTGRVNLVCSARSDSAANSMRAR